MPPSNTYGISVDIGTTHVTLHLVRLSDLHVVSEQIVQNPQMQFGADIISRISHAIRKKENAKQLTNLIRASVADGITSILKYQQLKPSLVTQVTVVGNTVMHHLFFDLAVNSLSKAPFIANDKNPIRICAANVGISILDEAECYSPPLVESFVGADASAMLLASGFFESRTNHIAIDVGTNTEIAVKSSMGSLIASAASGPAFEGMSMECGMPGHCGAISDLEIDRRTFKPTIEVMCGGKPSGICGTGAISALSEMLEKKIILSRGSFNRELNSRWLNLDGDIAYYILADNKISATGQPIVISQPDVRMLQQSKAAIRGVLDVLLHESELDTMDVQSLYLTGVFGSGLQIEDAYRIGMFPRFDRAKIMQYSKGASLGADLLMIPNNRSKIEKLIRQLNYVEMSDNPAFKAQYFSSIPFPD
ncbi:MAG: ASKHA domain-containing protein [Candidatus Thorarchaeota archaeon]|nr:ASKHA domain-containing protein [Candidatus Thorarchaeota archaeon]